MFTRIFISFIIIITATVATTSTAITFSGVDGFIPRLLVLITILGGATGVFYFILVKTLRHPIQKQEAENNSAQELEQLKASLTASMSHELRTPLNAIIGFTGIILQGMSGDINKRQRDQLERVLDSAKKLLSMIVDIISIAKIDAGSAGTFPTTFFVNEAVREATHEFNGENYPNFNDVVIKVDIPHKSQIYADRKKMMQCVINTLICIVECTDIKNITITAHEADKHLDIIIGTSQPGPDQGQLNTLINSLEAGQTEDGTSCNIRLHLTKKMISKLLGGSMSVNKEPGNSKLMRLTFSSAGTSN